MDFTKVGKFRTPGSKLHPQRKMLPIFVSSNVFSTMDPQNKADRLTNIVKTCQEILCLSTNGTHDLESPN